MDRRPGWADQLDAQRLKDIDCQEAPMPDIIAPAIARSHVFVDGGIQAAFTELPEEVVAEYDQAELEGRLMLLHSPSRTPGEPPVDCWLAPERLVFVGPPGPPQRTTIGDPSILQG